MIGAADERRLHQTDLDDFARFAHKDFVDLMLVMVAEYSDVLSNPDKYK